MVGCTAVGRVVNPKSTEKSMNFALETAKPMSKEKQLVTIQMFLHKGSKVQEYIKQNTMLSLVGRLDVGMYEGKRTIRIVTDSRSVQLLDTRNKSESGSSSGTPPSTPPPEAPAEPKEEKVADTVISDKKSDDDTSVWD